MKVMVYDTETGGLDSTKHSVFSVGALVGDLDTGEILDMFEAYHRLPSVNDYVYGPKAIEIHGITPQQAFDNGISTEEIQAKFVDMWNDHCPSLLGGHNEFFDRCMMSDQIFQCSRQEFEANFSYRAIDTLPVIRLITGHDNVASGASLTQAIKLLNIDMSDYGKNKFHAALFDSICTFRVAHKVRSVFKNADVAKLLTK